MAGRDGFRVLVGDRRYETDVEAISWRTVPPTRSGADQGAGPGEQSLSMENIWRRSRDNWRHGAGQEYADLIEESDPLRFYTSDGIDPFTPRSLRILPATDQKRSSANTNLKALSMRVAAVDYLVVVDGTSILYSSDPTAGTPTFTAHTGLSGSSITDITTDGRRWWACDGTSIYYGTPGTAAVTSLTTQDADVVGYANGRLLAADGNVLYEISSNGVATELFTHPDPGFVWTGFAPSPAGIYAFGVVGDTSEIFVITAIDATGALDVPFVAAAWPQGERINAMVSYAGVMIIASTRGVRMARIQGGGFLAYGPVIDEPGDVLCLEPQGEDVYFGWTYTSAINGVGRLHLARTTDPDGMVPAFATDVMARGTVSGNVLAVCTVSSRRFFAISGRGFYGQEAATVLEATGTIDFGWFTYGISEEKMLDSITVWCDELPASCSIVANVYADGNASPILTMTVDTDGAVKQTAAYSGTTKAERLRLTLTVTQSGTTSVVIRRVTLRSSPRPFIAQVITLPLFLADTVNGEHHQVGQNPYDEWTYLENLVKARTRFALAVGTWTADARLEALEVEKGGLGGGNGLEGWADDDRFLAGKWEATFVTQEPSS